MESLLSCGSNPLLTAWDECVLLSSDPYRQSSSRTCSAAEWTAGGSRSTQTLRDIQQFMKLWITADDAFKRATEASSRQNIDFKIHVRILKKDHLFYKSYLYITAYKHVDWAETNIIWSVCVLIWCFFVFWLYCEGNEEDFYFHTSCYFLSKWNWRHQISHS